VDGESHNGQVLAFESDPDPATFTHAVRIRLEGDDLLPGQLASADLPLRPQSGVLLVPLTAVLQEEGQAYVFVLDNGHLRRLPITLGMRYRNSYVVLDGLQAGQDIVKQDVAALTDGQQAVAVQP
jgi:multidrug efflux pump subunit AcrA (membrane-fusion protein)